MCIPKYKEVEEVKEVENLNQPMQDLDVDDISDTETVILHDIDLSWEESYFFDQLKFESGFLAAEDSTIIDLYQYHFPYDVYSVLRKGCDYDVYKKAVQLEEDFDAKALSIDPECWLHIYGLFYKEKDQDHYTKFYCLHCMRREFSNNREDIDVYSLHNYIHAYEIDSEITSMVTNYKYWCYSCNRFLFHIDYDEVFMSNNCISCLSVVPHDPKYIEDISATEVIGQLPNNTHTIPEVDLSWPVPI